MNLDEKIERLLKKVDADKITAYAQRHIVEKNYIIYDSKNNVAVCTRCGQKHWIEKGEYSGLHNTKGICPECYAEAVYKSKGIGRKNITEYFRMLYMFRSGKTACAAEMYCRANFNNFGKPIIQCRTNNVYEFSSKGSHRYTKEYNYMTAELRWVEKKTINIPCPAHGASYYSYSKYDNICLYEDNLEEVFTKSDLKYLWIPEFMKELTAYGLIRYADQGMKYQSIELLLKAGFTAIVKERITPMQTGAVYWRGKTLQKILRLPMWSIRQIRERNPSYRELLAYRFLSDKEKRELPWWIVQEIAREYPMERYRENIEKYTTLRKFAEYAQMQINMYKDHGRQFVSLQNIRIDWTDYLETARKLGMDIRRKQTLFPEDLKAAHDEVMNKYSVEKNKILDKQIAMHLLRINYELGQLQVIEASSQLDLNKESSGLGHCVKTYGDRLASGRCRIFFIRNKDDEETPFYTLETKPDGEFVQCRGKSNCSMTKEVETFVNEFIKELKKALKKEAKKCKTTTQSATQPAA